MKFSLFYPILKKNLALWNALFLGQKALEALVLGYTFSLRMYPGGVKMTKGGRNDTYTDPSVNGFLRETVYQVYTTTTGIHIYMSRGHSWTRHLVANLFDRSAKLFFSLVVNAQDL